MNRREIEPHPGQIPANPPPETRVSIVRFMGNAMKVLGQSRPKPSGQNTAGNGANGSPMAGNGSSIRSPEEYRVHYAKRAQEHRNLATPDFNIARTLGERPNNTKERVVHIGYGTKPLALNHPPTNGREFIGVEANMNSLFQSRKDGTTRKKIVKEIEDQGGNSFFIDIDTGFNPDLHEAYERVPRSSEPGRNRKRRAITDKNRYDPTSPLDDGTADITFVEYAFDDPQIRNGYLSGSGDRARALFNEIMRVTGRDGIAVFHETDRGIDNVLYYAKNDPAIQVLGIYEPATDLANWERLETDFYTDTKAEYHEPCVVLSPGRDGSVITTLTDNGNAMGYVVLGHSPMPTEA